MVTTVDQRQKWRTWADGKLALGLCPRCGKNPIKPGRSSCRACVLKAQRRRKRLYHERLQKGLCPHCGGERDVRGVIGCRSCNEKNAVRRVVYYDRGKKALYQRRLGNRRRREGLCPTCGRGIDDPAFKRCSLCRQKSREYYYSNHERILEAAHRRYDHQPKPLCAVCGHHRYRCGSCGKMMKVNHGQESCLYTCKCGNSITFTRENALQSPIM